MGRDAIVGGVLSIAKLTPGQEGYYERSVAGGLDDYYAGRGESPGIWTGRGAAGARARGRRRRTASSAALIRGSHPHTGSSCARHPKPRTITIERIDPLTGRAAIETEEARAGRRLRPRLLAAEERQPPARARRRGDAPGGQRGAPVRLAGGARLPRGRGVRRPPRPQRRRSASTAAGFVAAAYQHRTSRAQDPHLHTHVIVANMAQSPSDGKWRALDGEAILKTYRLAAGYLYQAQLRAELSRTLGVEWETAVQGHGRAAAACRGEVLARVLDAARCRSSSSCDERWRRAATTRRRWRRSRRASARSTSTSASCARTGGRAPPSTASAAASCRRSLGRTRR